MTINVHSMTITFFKARTIHIKLNQSKRTLLKELHITK